MSVCVAFKNHKLMNLRVRTYVLSLSVICKQRRNNYFRPDGTVSADTAVWKIRERTSPDRDMMVVIFYIRFMADHGQQKPEPLKSKCVRGVEIRVPIPLEFWKAPLAPRMAVAAHIDVYIRTFVVVGSPSSSPEADSIRPRRACRRLLLRRRRGCRPGSRWRPASSSPGGHRPASSWRAPCTCPSTPRW